MGEDWVFKIVRGAVSVSSLSHVSADYSLIPHSGITQITLTEK